MPRRARRMRPLTKILIGITALVLATSGLKALLAPGPPSRCVVACSAPPVGASVGAVATFSSPRYGFSFDYPAGGQPIKVGGSGVTGLVYTANGQFRAQVLVGAGFQRTSLANLVDSEASALSGLRIQNVRATGAINGAEVGFIPGDGEFYSGDYTDDTGAIHPVQLGIVAVQRPSGWVYLVGIGTVGSQSTPVGYGVIDDILDRWRWSG